MTKLIVAIFLIGLLLASINSNKINEIRKEVANNVAENIYGIFNCTELYIFVEKKLNPYIYVVPIKNYISTDYPETTSLISTKNASQLADHLDVMIDCRQMEFSQKLNDIVIIPISDNGCSSKYHTANYIINIITKFYFIIAAIIVLYYIFAIYILMFVLR